MSLEPDETFDESIAGSPSSIGVVGGSSGVGALRVVPSSLDTIHETECSPRAASTTPEVEAVDQLQRGESIGRYLVLGSLGAGAMGEVLAAYDPDLDRKVAIKLIKPRGWDVDVARARLHREAQALAKLRHPNVIVVHDVGLQGERLFVAMEHVEGITLGKWMSQHDGPRGYRAVLDVFLAAGRGLAAAHAAGLVHRDFKPENVMLADDGRVLVLDFGLARAIDQDEALVSEVRGELARLASSATQTGALVGTPAYMAPEQFERRADARSDQFAFCVALYEALHGQRPFAGENPFELCSSVTSGELRDPPKGMKVPAWLHRVVVRGLATAPAQRWASVEELLAALQDDPAARRRKWLVGGVVIAAVAMGALGIGLYVDARAERCSGAAERLADVWDDARRAEVRDALMATGVAFADSTSDRVEERVDGVTEAWVDARDEACRSTQRAEQSAELLDLRMHCYDRWLDGLDAQLDVLAKADATVARGAASAVASLPSLDACADVDALRDEHPLPSEPDARAQIDDALHGLDRVVALERAAKLQEAADAASELVAEGERLEYPPLLAQALKARGGALVLLGEDEHGLAVLEQGYEVALGSRLVDDAAMIAGLLVGASSVRLGDDERATHWALHARALGRASHTPLVQAAVLGHLGHLAFEQDRLSEAGELYARAAALTTEAVGREHPKTAQCLTNLGNVAARNGDFAHARESFQQALEIMERTLGPDHPDLVATASNLSHALAQEGRDAEAKALAERALALAQRTLSVDHPLRPVLLVNLAAVSNEPGARRSYLEQALAIQQSTASRLDDQLPVLDKLAKLAWKDGRYDDARVYLEQALQGLESGARDESIDTGGTLARLGNVAHMQRRYDRAQELFLRALEWQTTNLGAEHEEVASTLNNLGMTLHALGRYEAARSRHAQALAIREKVLAADHPHMSYSWTGLGLALTELGRVDEAIPLLEQALELRKREQSAAPLLAETRFGLARALWARGTTEDRARARELATAARDGYAGDDRFESEAAEVVAWLREVGGGGG